MLRWTGNDVGEKTPVAQSPNAWREITSVFPHWLTWCAKARKVNSDSTGRVLWEHDWLDYFSLPGTKFSSREHYLEFSVCIKKRSNTGRSNLWETKKVSLIDLNWLWPTLHKEVNFDQKMLSVFCTWVAIPFPGHSEFFKRGKLVTKRPEILSSTSVFASMNIRLQVTSRSV